MIFCRSGKLSFVFEINFFLHRNVPYGKKSIAILYFTVNYLFSGPCDLNISFKKYFLANLIIEGNRIF